MAEESAPQPRSGVVKRALTALVGGTLTAIGVVLLVLPGPGFVLIAAGLAVLAREFSWAERPLEYAKRQADDGINKIAGSVVYAGLDAVTGAGLIAVGVLDLVVGLPYLEAVSDVFLMLSGMFLIAAIGYARRRGHVDLRCSDT